MSKPDVWNPTIKILRNQKTPDNIRHQADLLLSAYNTAAGSIIMRPDLELFLERNKKYIK